MTLMRDLVKRAAPNLNDPRRPITNALIDALFGSGGPSRAGTTVSENRALTLSAVWRAVNLISALGSAIPFHAIGKDYKPVDSILEDPHPSFTSSEWRRLMLATTLLYGDSYALKIRNRQGRIERLSPVHPRSVQCWWLPGDGGSIAGQRVYRATLEDGSLSDILTEADVFHHRGFSLDGVTGMSVVRKAAFESLGLSLAAEEHGARFFGSGAQMQGFLTLESDEVAKDEEIKKLKARWRELSGVSNSHEVAVLEGNVKFHELSINNEDAQFLQTRAFQIEEIARWFGVPPFLLMATQKSTSWGTGLEQQATAFNVFDLVPSHLKPFEDRCTKDLLEQGSKARFDTSWLLRGDAQSRGMFYRIMREIGAMNANEVREREYMPPIAGDTGDVYLQPTNLAPLGWSPTPTPAAPGGDE